jgi:hypothetical protein
MPDHPSPTPYCLRIEILDSDPPIWRRFCVDPQLTLAELHPVLATVMGWSGAADYRFKAPTQQLDGVPLNLQHTDARVHSLKLQDLMAPVGDPFAYTYNTAQGWIHSVTMDSVQPLEPERQPPYCLEGEQACPPEFCVGIWGYEELMERLGDPDDPDYDQLWEQVGYDFDPNWFDLKAINQRLQG